MKLKILTVVGTRPEIIRLSCILDKFNKFFNSYIINTHQNYDKNLNKNIFDDLDIKGKILNLKFNSKLTFSQRTFHTCIEVEKLILKLKPDIFFVLGDTNSSLTAIVAKNYRIPIFHMEAGNRCFDQRVPEEINRKIVDSIADINLTYSSISREYLIRENFPQDRIIKVGSPMNEVFNKYSSKINSSKILNKLKIRKENYIVASFHRSENIDDVENLNKILEILNFISKFYKKKIIVSTHPRTQKKLSLILNKYTDNHKIFYAKPFNYTDFMALQMSSFFVISDSGTISEESSICGFKAINLRMNHERPEAMEEGVVILNNLNLKNTINAIDILLNTKTPKIVNDYSYDNVSEKVVRVISSYYNYVNNYNWKKNL